MIGFRMVLAAFVKYTRGERLLQLLRTCKDMIQCDSKPPECLIYNVTDSLRFGACLLI